MNIVAKIKNASLYPLAYSIVSAQSLAARMKALGKKPTVHFEQPYQGQKILLLALYEKGRLRADIENLLITAKSLGMYVLAVNTLKVLKPDSLKDKVDCYIERPNFGRDFGSYQTGFLHIYKKGWERECERLLMLNDSLFYSKTNLKAFLEQMLAKDMEILGATENFEEDHHLGSFCISFSEKILKNKLFRKYWTSYKKSDLRPKVIERGEKKLSKISFRCASDESKVRALFDVTWLSNVLRKDPKLVNTALLLSRDSLHPWPQPTLKKIAGDFVEKFMFADFGLAEIEANKYFAVTDLDHLSELLENYAYIDNSDIKDQVRKIARSEILRAFKIGSQIHQNAILLHSLGLPIVKLDALYRGVLSVRDVEEIAMQLLEDERSRFLFLLNKRPFGGDTLVGWKKAAFNQGLI